MPMTMTERAAKLKISQSYLSMIYKGKRIPGWGTAWRWESERLIKKDYMWWRKATTKQIQRVLDAIK